MSRFLVASLALMFALLTMPALARSLNERLHQDQWLIERGHRDGSLSRHEIYRLQREQNYILREKQAAWSDGYLSRHERRRLSLLETQHRRNIRRERAD